MEAQSLIKCLLLTEEQFESQFTVIPNHLRHETAFGGMYETFGEELDYIWKMQLTPEKRKVWTIIDSGDGMSIISGYHLVDRVGYLITEQQVPEDTFIEVTIELDCE